MWYLVGRAEEFPAVDARGFPRIHVMVNERAISIFKTQEGLTAIDSVCAHAGGDLTHGSIVDVDIEDLSISAVACPLHRYLYAVAPAQVCGAKVYQSVSFVHGKPGPTQWKSTMKPQSAQRSHRAVEREGHIYLEVSTDEVRYASDASASKAVCTRAFEFHGSPVAVPDFVL